jgi:hypothetical protein
LFKNEDARSRANPVLKCLDGPANIVRPGVIPPSTEPESATLIIGTEVVIISFLVKILLSASVSVKAIVLFFNSFSLSESTKLYKISLIELSLANTVSTKASMEKFFN